MGCSSVVKCLSTNDKALGSILSTIQYAREGRKGGRGDDRRFLNNKDLGSHMPSLICLNLEKIIENKMTKLILSITSRHAIGVFYHILPL